jgi:hypothetical protein
LRRPVALDAAAPTEGYHYRFRVGLRPGRSVTSPNVQHEKCEWNIWESASRWFIGLLMQPGAGRTATTRRPQPQAAPDAVLLG